MFLGTSGMTPSASVLNCRSESRIASPEASICESSVSCYSSCVDGEIATALVWMAKFMAASAAVKNRVVRMSCMCEGVCECR